MCRRVRSAIGIALTAALMTITSALAKGSFDFITITGPDLKEAVRVTDASLTEDFFTFANFYEDKTEAPESPGKGYEITRHYVQGLSDVVFDRIHYYPETGFVFYDGIENGDSEYDGEWYTANPAIQTVFESALIAHSVSVAPAAEKEPVTSEAQPLESQTQAKPVLSNAPFLILLVLVFGVGLAAVFAFAIGRRKPTTQ